MEEKFVQKTWILAKVEATQGVDSVPTGAADAILVSDVSITPLEGDVVERNNLRPFFGGSGSAMASTYSKVSFSVEAAGVAVPGTAPGYSALLRACACAATIAEDANVTYTPVSGAMESVTIHVGIDGILHKLTSAMGSVKLAADAKSLPKWQFEFTGMFSPLVDSAIPQAAYNAFQSPLSINKANTTLQLLGVPVVASAFSFDMGLTVVKRDLINLDSVAITGRKSVGSVTFQNTAIATKDWVGLARASTLGPLALVHGPAAGPNVIELRAPNVQLGKPTYAEQDGVQMVVMPLEYIPTSAGNDEWSIVVR